MPAAINSLWLSATKSTITSYRRMIDAAIEQLSDEEFFARPNPESNSVAIVLRHLGGNLISRWTEFLTTDGEKPDRNRDAEFLGWGGDRDSLYDYFDRGWKALEKSIESLNDENVIQDVKIRGESHTVPQAIVRSLTHISYHTGQIMLIARMAHKGTWNWLTIAPNDSETFNQRTWGTTASRAIMGVDPNDTTPGNGSTQN